MPRVRCCSPPERPGRPRGSSIGTDSSAPSWTSSGPSAGSPGEDRLVAAFAPFALYGPALGIAAAVPDMDVTKPASLTAGALADAAAAIDATLVFASPSALRNVAATAGTLTADQRRALDGIRLVLSAGAPVSSALLRKVQAALPRAELHTPYGMTEALPVTDISLAEIEAAGSGNGVCVGRPLPGVRVMISPLDQAGAATGELTSATGVTGEICVAAAHVKDRYDRLWATERDSARDQGWHRTGDVGHLDDHGRLWVEGRLVHVITTADGPVTPVAIEHRIELVDGVDSAAVVGVGPAGTQQIVAVVVASAAPGRPGAGPRRPAGSDGSRRTLADPILAIRAWPIRARRCDTGRRGCPGRGRVASPGSCPPTSGTRPRSTARDWPAGPRGFSRGVGPAARESPGHRGQRPARRRCRPSPRGPG